MKRMLSITFAILFTAALGFSSEKGGALTQENPGCIVMPEVIEACESGGGRFDFKLCSCVNGN